MKWPKNRKNIPINVLQNGTIMVFMAEVTRLSLDNIKAKMTTIKPSFLACIIRLDESVCNT